MTAIIHSNEEEKEFCRMIWLIILASILIIVVGLLLAPIGLFIDTRIATIYFRWMGVGYAMVIREQNDWWLKIRVLFFVKKWKLADLLTGKPAKRKTRIASDQRKKRKKISPGKILHVLTTFRVTKWEAALDTGDDILNAWLYPLNFLTQTNQHLFVNFTDVNYLAITLKSLPARMVYSWLNY